MSSCPTLYVSVDIATRAERLICTGNGDKLRDGVELLLKNDLTEVYITYDLPISHYF